jgi:hypothetical protein
MPWTHDTKPYLLTKGPLIVHLESVFFHWQRYPRRRVTPATPPLHETARPRELEQPYRAGHGHIFRIPLTRRAVVVGYWEPAGEAVLEGEESQRLMDAVEGAMIPGITATEISSWARGRQRWWTVLLARIGVWLDRRSVVPSTTTTVTSELSNSGVIPWDDGKIYDLEDARVNHSTKEAQ